MIIDTLKKKKLIHPNEHDNFTKKNNQLESSLAAKTQKSFAEIQNYLHSFHENEDQSCIDLAAFIIENITDKSANIELLKKIYGTK